MATPEQLRQCAAAMLAAADGKEIEYFEENHWYAAHTDAGMWNVNATYRVKPEPKLRPWKQEEVPIGALLKDTRDKQLVGIISSVRLAADESPAVHGCGFRYELLYLARERFMWCWSHEQFDGKWRECGVME